jgi:hypothetical protein
MQFSCLGCRIENRARRVDFQQGHLLALARAEK